MIATSLYSFYLSIRVHCLPKDQYSRGAYFVLLEYYARLDDVLWKIAWDYHQIGTGTNDNVISTVEELLQYALQDFVRAHY